MRTFRKSTIREVASLAGVSTTTVSLFISGRESVCSTETAQRIRRAVEELNYTPNSLTRGLRSKTQRTLGVCLESPMDPEIAYGAFFFESMWRGIIAQADRDNYCLLHYPTQQRSGGSCDVFLDGRVDGILLQDMSRLRAQNLVDAGMPTILLASAHDLPHGCGAAYADDSGTSTLALDYLWALGHRRIAHVAGPVGDLVPARLREGQLQEPWRDDVAVQRLHGYLSWAQAHGASDPDLIAYPQSWIAADLSEILLSWRAMSAPPTAIYCVNDALAASVIQAARKVGMRVPDDLSIVGVDDSELSRTFTPELTSVKVPLYSVGQAAVAAMMALLAGHQMEQCRLRVPVTELAVRASAAPLHR